MDSAPVSLTRPLAHRVAPTLLLLFCLVSTVLLFAINEFPALMRVFPNRDFVFSPYGGTHSVPIRIFIISFYVAFTAVAGASAMSKLRLLIHTLAYFVIICCAFDLLNLALYDTYGVIPSIHVVEILSGVIGYLVFAMNLLSHGSMPARAEVPFSRHFKLVALMQLSGAIGLAIIASMAVNRMALPLLEELRGVALLGGIGPGIFLFLPVLFLVLYIAGTIQVIVRRKSDFAPPLTVIIPAHNEAHIIGRTIAALDAAAAGYGNTVLVLVLDNCSTDNTASAARAAFEKSPSLTGRVVDVPTPGKAIALNRGIAETRTEFVVRIDADTQVQPETLRRAMTHFSRERVGVVGGMPLPPGTGPFDRARLLEVLLKHGYYQVAFGAADCIVGIAGMFAAYRTEQVRAVGGFVTGMNGEDTDATLRIGESGYRAVGDPLVTYTSEVPATYRHLREQRMRWFRSVYHVSARNLTYLDGWRFSVRGKMILPFMLLNSASRAMMVPLTIFGVLCLALAVDPQGTLTAQAVLAVLIGAPALMAAFAALANGRPGALLGLPEYIMFRMVRAYLTLESALSIVIADPSPRLQTITASPPASDGPA